MPHGRDLRMDEGGSSRLRPHAIEVLDQCVEAVEHTYVAEELRRQLLLLDDALRDPWP
jgi:hypothetical protein